MAEKKESAGFEFIVHIGSGKTGSSSIQKSLSASRQKLLEHGIAYLGLMGEESPVKQYAWQVAGGWPELMKLGKAEAAHQLADLLGESIRTLRAQGCRGAIWSNETIFGNDKVVIPILRELQAQGIVVKVIVYIRRHDAWARSAYLQWGVKHKTDTGPVKSFREWYRARGIRFASGLEPWLQQAWGDLAVRNFDACGDVVADFLDYYGLRYPGIVVRKENETPNSVVLALWAIFNSQFEEQVLPVRLQRLLKRAGLLDKPTVDVDFMALLPAQQDIDHVKQDCSEDRQRVNEIFARFAQPEMEVSPIKIKQLSVTQNQINAALLMMIKQQSDEIQRLSRKLKDLAPDDDSDVE